MLQSHTVWLFAGVMTGLGLVLAGSISGISSDMPADAVAQVNDVPVSAEVYRRALHAVDTDLRGGVSQAQQQHILERLIDEELLIQHALQQGLARSDRRLRSALADAALEATRLAAQSREISDEEARAFHAQHQALFAGESRYRVGLIRVPFVEHGGQAPALSVAQQARQALQNDADFAAVAEAYHRGGALNLPDTWLPRGKLLDYLGAELTAAVLELDPGEAAEPAQLGQAWQLLVLRGKQHLPAASFEQVRPQVIAEMRRRHAESMLRNLLADLRASQRVQINEAAVAEVQSGHVANGQ